MSAKVRIDSLQAGHRPDVASIVRATGVFTMEEEGVALELFDAAALDRAGSGDASAPNRDTPADYEFIGAFTGERLVGFACFGPTPATQGTFDLYWIAVHPEAQRSGAGAALMTEVERRLQDRGGRLVVVETSSRAEYAPTRRFYDRRGYAENARLRDFYAPGDDRVILTRRLVAAPAPASAGQ